MLMCLPLILKEKGQGGLLRIPFFIKVPGLVNKNNYVPERNAGGINKGTAKNKGNLHRRNGNGENKLKGN